MRPESGGHAKVTEPIWECVLSKHSLLELKWSRPRETTGTEAVLARRLCDLTAERPAEAEPCPLF